MADNRTISPRAAVVVVVVVVGAALGPLLAVVALAAAMGGSSQAEGVEGIPPRVLQAYQAAGGRCEGLDWTVLAAVGGVESNHGQSGGAEADPASGEVRPWIFGSPLDGSGGRARISIGNYHGWWGLSGAHQRAVGPMQFLPSTFEGYAVDADGDGVANPHDIDDAVSTAANYVCAAAGGRVGGLAKVGRIYNPGGGASYVAALEAEHRRIHAALASGGETVNTPDGPIRLSNVQGIEVNASIAQQVDALLNHARAAGFELARGSSGYRDPQRQIELRRQNCGASHYATYEMPASQCSPPTAQPGRSMHERGLAIDFVCNGSLMRARSSPCFQWLDANAARYGLTNLPSEPWHWSTNGQ